ncbi:NADH:flavin oxidoreductase/NADH oxidase [Demequina sp. SYSU T00039]|uniref:NADH:flavin oxidoreductase/NADH oxidase n=1 Tax=Demequina lignilytica TaxID=3051663 RepID=A0AAW7M6L6_9MICO|nr:MULTISPECIES: NADH:flavin oxidoreductase/NADH oxidase [unclassified Demequina]MDN4477653.1 NADH:flavin oxidoreductase/NADH oxidase [Demequina sp. SYSU T00039-1]MDN4487996.1 NADH:flavin oxidoreductase/NADH oxidase [Demequina sp. SYSU T00039]
MTTTAVTRTSALFAPLRLRDLELRNRVGVSPMCMFAVDDESGCVNAWHAAHYGQFALGGAGLIITEATGVSPEGRVSAKDAGLWTEEHAQAWRVVTDTVHRAGAAIAVQLGHTGRKGSLYRALAIDPRDERGSIADDAHGGWETIGASGEAFGSYKIPREGTTVDLEQVVADFGNAARLAVVAGFDAVELHAAHGYLVHEFLSPVTNPRVDEWGQDKELLLLKVVDAVRAQLPDSMPLIVRLSVDDVAPGGLTAADSADLARRLKDRGVDMIDCSSGGLIAGVEYDPSPGYQVPGSATVRSGAEIATAAVGMIAEPALAERIVAEGEADVVLLGREMLRDPHWARRAERELTGAATIEPRYFRAYR